MKYYIEKCVLIIIFFIITTKFWNYYLYFNSNPLLKPIKYKFNTKKNNINIKILSYNLFLLPDPFFCNILDHKHSDFKNERCKKISNIIKDYDIIIFQEIHPYLNYRCSILIEKAKQVGLIYYYYNLGPSFFSKYCLSNGLLIISRYPIIDKETFSYTQSESYDTLMEKGCSYVKIKINEHLPHLHVFNTHLQASYDKNKNWDKIRKKQLDELKMFIKKKCNYDNDYIILGGDFNIDYYSKEFIHLNNICKLKDTFIKKKLNHTITIPYNTKNEENTSLCILCKKCIIPNNYKLENQKLDYIFFSEKENFKLVDFKILPNIVKNTKVPFKQLSDHYAITTILNLKKLN